MISNLLVSRLSTIKLLYVFNICISVLYVYFHGITANQFAVVFIIWFLMNPLGIAVVYHRYWSHKVLNLKILF